MIQKIIMTTIVLLFMVPVGQAGVFGWITDIFISSPNLDVLESNINTSTENKIYIPESRFEWNIVKHTDNEANFDIILANLKDKKTDICFVLKNGVNPANVNLTAKFLYNISDEYILDDKNKVISIKYETAKCNGKDGYHISLTDAQMVNVDDYIRFGEGTIILIYQESKEVIFSIDDMHNISSKLYWDINGDMSIWNNSVSDLFVDFYQDKWKSGAWHNNSNGWERYKYVISSNAPLKLINGKYYFMNETNKGYRIFTDDICSKEHYVDVYNETDGITYSVLNGTADCQFISYELEGISYLEIMFFSDSLIDPSYGYEIIRIANASHLDSSRVFITDVFDYVISRDENFTKIPVNDYLRVTFEYPLDNTRDITIYAKGNGSIVEVYEKDNDTLLTTFPIITPDKKYSINLTSLSHEQDTFDFKVLGASVDFDLVIDPIGSGNFTSVWNTSKTSVGSTNSTAIHLPLEAGGTYNFIVDWGDGSSDVITAYNQAETTHNYAAEGAYTINITGTIMGWTFNNVGDKLKLIDIQKWGDLQLGNSGGYFYGTTNLNITATDSLNLTGTTSLVNAFRSSGISTVPSMNEWDLSGITRIDFMFVSASDFNQNISDWNTSGVTNMNNVFQSATAFNQDIGNWDVSSVTAMQAMFQTAYAFNQDISNWNTSNVATFYRTFYLATAFNQNLSDWNTSSVTNMREMFHSASAFNSNISNWDTSKVTNMRQMFRLATNFNSNISNWDTGKVTDMFQMFYEADAFNQPIGNWDTSSVDTVTGMFTNSNVFNQPLDNWDVSKFTDTANMFQGNPVFNQNLSSWNLLSASTVASMFRDATAFNGNITTWDVHKVADMDNLFRGAIAFNQPIGIWDVSNVTDMSVMFYQATSFNQPLINWNVSKVTDMNNMFRYANLFDQDISSWNVSNVADMTLMFSNAGLSTVNYDKLLIGWNNLSSLQSSVTFDAGTSTYTEGVPNASRQNIIDTYTWTIIDGGIIADTVAPNLVIILPVNGTVYNVSSVILNVSAYDVNLQTILYNWNGTNDTYLAAVNITYPAGTYNMTVWANDTYGNLNTSTVVFTINVSAPPSPVDTAPIVYLNTTDGINNSGNSLTQLNCSAVDDSGLVNLTLFTNITGSFIQNQTANLNNATLAFIDFNLTGLLNGTYTWNCLAYDNASQYNWSDTNRTFVINESLPPEAPIDNSPTVYLNTTDNINFSGNVLIQLNCSAVDDHGLYNLSLFTNITGSFIQNQTVNLSNQTLAFIDFNITGLINGTYLWGCLGYDNNTQYNWSDTNRTLIINQSLGIETPIDNPPVVYLNTTDGINNTGNALTQLNCSAVDDHGLYNASLWTNITGSFIQNQSVNLNNQTLAFIDFNITGILNGTYLWNCLFYDNNTQYNWSDTNRTFIINESEPPAIPVDNSPYVYLNTTDNINNSGNSLTQLNCSATDDHGLYNISLWTNITGSFIQNQSINLSNETLIHIDFNLTGLLNGTYVWNCLVYDNNTQYNWSDTNRTFIINESSLAVDDIYPLFSNYSDNNASLTDSGIGQFNVSIENTNGTVYLEINNINVSASNLVSNIYNASYSFISGGTYVYRWHSWGNGTSENYNVSIDRSYFVNTSVQETKNKFVVMNYSTKSIVSSVDYNGDWFMRSINLTIVYTNQLILSQILTVNGNATFNGNVDVNGNVNVTQNLTVDGLLIFRDSDGSMVIRSVS